MCVKWAALCCVTYDLTDCGAWYLAERCILFARETQAAVRERDKERHKKNACMQQCPWTRRKSSITETAKIVCRAIEHGDRQPVGWIAIRSFKKSSSDACAGADGDFAGDL